LLAARGVEETWRRSIAEALAVIDLLDARIAPLHEQLRPFAAADPRVLLLRTIPGIGELLGLTFAAEIGDVARFASAPAGRLRRSSVVAPDQPLARALRPAHRPPRQEPRQVRRRPQGPDRDLARALARGTLQAQPPARHHSGLGKLPLLSGRLRPRMELRTRDSSHEHSAPPAPKEK
jgi:hypothetical protein